MGGVTAVRDMAGDVRALGSLQRDALLAEIPSPDIYYAALFAGPAFFADPRTHDASRGLVAGQVPWMRAITDSTDLHQAVAEARGTGATAIKLYAALSGDLAQRITTEAHAQGLAVWAHAALRPATPIEVVRAGVDATSHASLVALAMDSSRRAADLRALPSQPLDLDDAGLDTLFRTMVTMHTVFEPTLLVFADDPARLRLAGEITRRAHRAGVTMVAGTDTLAVADSDTLALPNLHGELELLVRLGGLSPEEALESATRNAAGVLRAQETRGTIAVGKLADLVVLSSNPLADIRNTRTVRAGHQAWSGVSATIETPNVEAQERTGHGTGRGNTPAGRSPYAAAPDRRSRRGWRSPPSRSVRCMRGCPAPPSIPTECPTST